LKNFCILGDERAFRSKAPAIFTTVLKRVGIRGAYVPFKVEPGQIAPALHSLRVLNIDGANIAIPYKEAVIPHLDVLSEGGNIVGAINTIVRNGDTLKGYNTNAIGFMDALEEIGFDAADKRALVFGNGGAAKAVVFILNWLRAETVMIAGRNEAQTLQITQRIGGESKPIPSLGEGEINADIIVNATSVSSPDESSELAAAVSGLDVRECELVVDLNYGRRNNFWQQLAEGKKSRFMDGLPTLAHQSRRSFSLWTRIDVEPEEFKKALEEEL
jgi:shikimate dehydrogenase